jgi:predicted PurR-regulated permease PerM
MRRFFLDPRTARATWTILVFLGALGLLYAMRGVLLIVALSLFFAYLLFPLVRLTQRWLIQSRRLAIVVVYLVVLAALGGAVVAVGPRLSTEVQSLAQQLPDMSKQIQSGELVRGLLARKGWEGQQIREVDRLVQTHMGEIIGYAQQGAAALLTWLAGAWVIVLVPIFAFFIVKDVERFTTTTIWRLGHQGHRRCPTTSRGSRCLTGSVCASARAAGSDHVRAMRPRRARYLAPEPVKGRDGGVP